jgi:hypothetical protein
MCNFRAHNLEEFKIWAEDKMRDHAHSHGREEEAEIFWMWVKGVCPNLFIYFTMYLVVLNYTLRI